MKYRSKPKIIDAEQWLASQESWVKIFDMGLDDWEKSLVILSYI